MKEDREEYMRRVLMMSMLGAAVLSRAVTK